MRAPRDRQATSHVGNNPLRVKSRNNPQQRTGRWRATAIPHDNALWILRSGSRAHRCNDAIQPEWICRPKSGKLASDSRMHAVFLWRDHKPSCPHCVTFVDTYPQI